RLGLGSIRGSGTWRAAEGTTLLDAATEGELDLEFAAVDALVLRSTGTKLRADADLEVAGRFSDRVDVTGDVAITSGTFVRRMSMVPDIARRGGVGVDSGIRLFEIPPPIGDALRFDVAVRTTEPLALRMHIVEAPVTVALRLLGTGARPYLEGAVSAQTGVLRLPAVSLEIDQALVAFRPDAPGYPDVVVKASGRRHGIDLTATATGRIDDIEVFLSSLPPLTQDELLVLVSTGARPETLRQRGLRGQATLVGGYLAQEILDFYFGSDSTERE